MSTTPLVAAEAPEAPQPINHFGRLFGVLFSPGRTFADIVQRPSWILPSVVLIVMSMLASVLLVQRVDWRDVISQQIEKNPRAADMSADQKEQRIEVGAKFAPIFGYVGGLIGPVVILLTICLVMWGAYSLLGGISTGFVTSLSITAHALMTSLVSTPLFLFILFLKPKGTIDIENPMATNLAAFLPDDASKWLVTLGKNLDIFAIWTLILLAIGFAAINPKKMGTGKAVGIGFAVWIAYVVIRTGIAWIFS